MGDLWRKARRASVAALTILFAVLAGSADASPRGFEDGAQNSAREALPKPSAQQCVPRETCCKVCRKGQACGNTCIRADYDCHKGRGCACNAEEVCD
jgi:hypothetical protein